MLKIQYGIAGFFTGAFVGLLFGLIEMRIINSSKHPAMLFIGMALTVIVCGIIGLMKGISLFRKKMRSGN
jgi:uncharacterized membrane protein